ncbi:MAG: tail fiber assembly protein [Pseudomonas sp.]|uniref:tail fiber assembly protein n=1 Tax=Pseudomonas sp. TaxID=306 RepID=UPI003D6EAE49
MKTHAYIYNGKVFEIIPPITNEEGDEIPITERFTSEFVAATVDISGLDPQPEQGWTYNGSVFAAPVVIPIDYTAINAATLATLNAQASQAMVPYFLATNLGNATDEETLAAKAWQAYYRALQLVDLTSPSPDWPVSPA